MTFKLLKLLVLVALDWSNLLKSKVKSGLPFKMDFCLKKIIKVSPIVHLPSSAFKRPVSCNMDNKDISWTKRTFLLQSILNSYLDFIKLTKVRYSPQSFGSRIPKTAQPYLLHFGNIQERHLWKKFKHRS